MSTVALFEENFSCTELEARSLRQKGLELAAAFAELRRFYAIEHLHQSEQIKKDLPNFRTAAEGYKDILFSKGGLKRFAQNKRQDLKLRGDLRSMWEAYQRTMRTEQELMFAHRVYSLTLDERRFVTRVLELLNLGRDLNDAQAVTEGREAYILLVKVSGLGLWLGFDVPKEDELWDTHDFYFRN